MIPSRGMGNLGHLALAWQSGLSKIILNKDADHFHSRILYIRFVGHSQYMILLALTFLDRPRPNNMHRQSPVMVFKKKCCKKYKDGKACKKCPIRRKR